jgi:PilZ domain
MVTNSFSTSNRFSFTLHPVLKVFTFRIGAMEEHRGKPRQRVLKAGTIEFDGGSIDCTVRNISPTGAALDVASPVGIPRKITLNIVSRRERQNCHIVWRKERRIGVAFAD